MAFFWLYLIGTGKGQEQGRQAAKGCRLPAHPRELNQHLCIPPYRVQFNLKVYSTGLRPLQLLYCILLFYPFSPSGLKKSQFERKLNELPNSGCSLSAEGVDHSTHKKTHFLPCIFEEFSHRSLMLFMTSRI